jgi:hypothetical protein
MSEVIKVKLNKDNRAIANLYGKEFDITKLADKSGIGEFKAFGETHLFEIVKNTKTKVVISKMETTRKDSETIEAEPNNG